MKAVELRNAQKKKKPHFRNHNSHKIKRTTKAYRRPRGIQNKMRLHHKSYSRVISSGFRSPVEARGLTRDGLAPVLVHSLGDMEGLESGKHGIVIGAGVGMKKRITLAEAASKAKLAIVNLKDVAGYAKQVEDALKSRQEKRKATATKREEAEKKAAKAEKVSKKEEAPTKEQEKKELDKVLTQKK